MSSTQIAETSLHDVNLNRWLPSHKPMLSNQSWPTTDGETSPSSGDESESYSGLGGVDDPFMYPSPFVIRNTFIDCEVSGPRQFDEFFQEREARSCPASKIFVAVDGAVDNARFTEECPASPAVLFRGEMPFKNTFVHFPVERASLVDERQTKSCPSSGVEMADGEWQVHQHDGTAQESVVTPVAVEDDQTSGAPVWQFAMASAATPDMQWGFDYPCGAVPVDEQFAPMTWFGFGTMEPVQQPTKAVLNLASAVPEPDTGSPEMPSVGSVGHWDGTCKPCAFMARGCTCGVSCPFCHLCDPNEKKRRRKDKITFLRELRRWKKNQVVFAANDQSM